MKPQWLRLTLHQQNKTRENYDSKRVFNHIAGSIPELWDQAPPAIFHGLSSLQFTNGCAAELFSDRKNACHPGCPWQADKIRRPDLRAARDGSHCSGRIRDPGGERFHGATRGVAALHARNAWFGPAIRAQYDSRLESGAAADAVCRCRCARAPSAEGTGQGADSRASAHAMPLGDALTRGLIPLPFKRYDCQDARL